MSDVVPAGPVGARYPVAVLRVATGMVAAPVVAWQVMSGMAMPVVTDPVRPLPVGWTAEVHVRWLTGSEWADVFG